MADHNAETGAPDLGERTADCGCCTVVDTVALAEMKQALADAQASAVRAVFEALDQPITAAWSAFMDGPGGKTEALRQGKYEGIVRGRDLAVQALRGLTSPPGAPT